MFLLLFLLFLFNTFNLHAQSNLPVFPEAQGFGTHTPGGRGGEVIKVTNLNDSGSGSLRAAIEAEGPRIVVFSVGGMINLHTNLIITNPFITIAGQTAPGDGICIRGGGIVVHTHDVVLRFLRIRPGEIDFGPPNFWANLDALSIGNKRDSIVYNIVVDHCSLSWGVDENVGIWGDAHDITIQNCIISEALQFSKHPKGPHSKGLLIGDKATNISIHHNLFAHNHERNPLINGESRVDVRNNIIYNSGRTAAKIINWDNFTKSQKVNYIGNYIIPGKNTINDWEIAILGKNKKGMTIFIENNLGPNISDYREDNWLLIKDDETEDTISTALRASDPFSFPAVTTHSPHEAYTIVLSEAGAILPLRDAVDRKTISDVKNNKGQIINHKIGILEWPPLERGIPFLDSDQDGMPDHWEEEYGLNPDNAADSNGDSDADGYTNIEEYINGTSPKSSLNERKGTVTPLNQNFSKLNLQLRQNFPNPFEDSTNLIFELPQPASTKLMLVNSEGKIINEFVNGFLYDGRYEITIDTLGLHPGVYFMVLVSNNHSKRIKMIRSGS